MGGIIPAVEPRIKASVLYVAGLTMERGRPEVEPINYLPRIKSPVLMLNGKYDFFFPSETSQKPFYNFLGPDSDHPQDIIEAVARDSIDVAIVWGPLAGYWAKRARVPMTLVALPDSDPPSGMIFAFNMAMGVRHSDRALAAREVEWS